MTTESARIDDQLRRGYDGPCWHGPAFREVLAGVTAEVAARHHPAVTHSIWTLVAHTSAWVEVVRRRLAEWRTIDLFPADDFPPVTDPSPAAWDATLAEFDRRLRDLRDAVAGLDPARLDEVAPGTDSPVAVMLHGTAQHMAYHAGQIALLKKLVG
jgi:hypothetical protein